ncbi:tRNA threonylcarbamoyladenosine biosynthesis protein TsaE [Arcanobacterium wilhelmae]|uniref:tRNA threonylcarbamoyladenosine biosynthesis protein TsaE n=1 Tax=Arcanobacterium wilhelmae TaxID=1803177 RepID=A0ABT9NCP8_9ACTO|nr:tRNA (adenosine(37)-N6)-threonylcarbamoyltransferase complex ATPase subunit type 1 TsaE [Arcanobacterium wilhelmae]MDP9801422.1 tRNA threonylcarbamoyladenosine biosynthesis protein TsaE [Arcanobacterium wilhelmae]WFN90757.1 tRNA (adenosine(37)-N6)-threonylcarbamoyltransferase complex ATPase subunit type 1 TsaE [Arcanobacterium wilhelmae]
MVSLLVPQAVDIQAVGYAIGQAAEPGDLVMLNGPLGAGKTTMTQGIARGLGIEGAIASPTFVIAQIHHGRIDLVHVDAYRLNSIEEIDALDLDTSLEDSLTVVEWGSGKVEMLAEDRLEIQIVRPEGSNEGEEVEDLYEDAPRTLTFVTHGPRSQALADSVLADPKVAHLERA